MKLDYNSPVILTFALLCTVATGLGYLTANASTMLIFSTYPASFLDPLMYLRLLTHTLGHSGWDHLLGNMLMLLMIGPLLEEKHGSRDTLIMIVLTALVTGILHNITESFSSNRSMLVGASGVVFMCITLSSFVNIRSGRIPITFVLVVILYIVQEFFHALRPDNVSQMAHIAGGVLGSIFGFMYRDAGSNSTPQKGSQIGI